jgi:hypothetical protein
MVITEAIGNFDETSSEDELSVAITSLAGVFSKFAHRRL